MRKPVLLLLLATVSATLSACMTGCGDALPAKHIGTRSGPEVEQSGNARFASAVCAAFRRQSETYKQNVRSEMNKHKVRSHEVSEWVMRAWGASFKNMADELKAITDHSVSDRNLLALRDSIAEQSEHLAALMLSFDVASSLDDVRREGEKLEKLQNGFNSYVKRNTY